jgi:hypothetical protein
MLGIGQDEGMEAGGAEVVGLIAQCCEQIQDVRAICVQRRVLDSPMNRHPVFERYDKFGGDGSFRRLDSDYPMLGAKEFNKLLRASPVDRVLAPCTVQAFPFGQVLAEVSPIATWQHCQTTSGRLCPSGKFSRST